MNAVVIVSSGRVHYPGCRYLQFSGRTRPATDLDLEFSPRCACWYREGAK